MTLIYIHLHYPGKIKVLSLVSVILYFCTGSRLLKGQMSADQEKGVTYSSMEPAKLKEKNATVVQAKS